MQRASKAGGTSTEVAAAAGYQYLLKLIIIGDTATGKSCLLLRFVDGHFRNNHELTIGVEFGAKTIAVANGAAKVKLQVWDTAGQETFRSITRSYYRGASGALVVYDVGRRETFYNVEKWAAEARANAGDNVVILLVGNKVDLDETNQRAVSRDEGLALARKHDMLFVETSARNNVNVSEAFQQLASRIHTAVSEGSLSLPDAGGGIRVARGGAQADGGGGCCG